MSIVRRIISLILVSCFLIGLLPMFVYAEENEVLVRFEVSETNSCAYDNFLIKRGFPLGKGVIFDANRVVVKDLKTNALTVPQTKTLEKYDDGSIKWLLVSMRTDLVPNETKEYALCKQKTTKEAESELSVISNEQKIVVDNGVYQAEFDGFGIKRLNYNGCNILDDRGEESVVKLSDGEHILRVGNISIEEQGSEFVRIKVEAAYYDSPLRVEKVYTVVAGSDKIFCDTRNVSYNGTGAAPPVEGVDEITSVYDKFNLNAGYDEITSNSEWINRDGNEVSEGSWVSAYSKKDGAGIIIASNDIAKFKNAVSELSAHNGFVKANGGKSLFVAPILYENPYKWVDGFSRTTHHFIVVYDKFPDIEGYIAGEYNSPQIKIDPQAFVNIGLLGSTYLSAPARAQIESLKWTKDKRNGRITAGSIPFGLDPEKGKDGSLGAYHVQLGEISYNAWFGVLSTGDGILYDIVNESCEEWADAMIYRGVVEEARGAGRYRVTENGTNNGHMYYSEFSNLYLAYLMTGNMYYYDSCKLMADLIYKVSMRREMSGFHVPKGPAWENNKMQVFSTTEIRASFQIRAMYNASKLFQDERYAYIASQIEKWVEAVQEKDGSWAQFINSQGGITLYAVSWPLYKNYISLYTIRGHCDYYEQTHDKGTIEMLSRFADYLINEIGDRGWMYDPCTNKEKCEMGEDRSRGKAPIQEIMASEVFYTVYKSIGEEKYLKAFCQVLESYFSTSRKSGLASQRFWDKDYGEKINDVITGQNLTLMRMDSKYAELIQNERDHIEKLGFKALAAMYCDGSSPDFSNAVYDYDEAEVSVNLYKTDKDERYLFIGNNSGAKSGEWDKEMKIRIKGGASVWTNADNIIRNIDETEITHPMSMFDSAVCCELPLEISSVTGDIHINNAVITDNGFSFDVDATAGKVAFTLESGKKLNVSGEKKHVTAELFDNTRDYGTVDGAVLWENDFSSSVSGEGFSVSNPANTGSIKNGLYVINGKQRFVVVSEETNLFSGDYKISADFNFTTLGAANLMRVKNNLGNREAFKLYTKADGKLYVGYSDHAATEVEVMQLSKNTTYSIDAVFSMDSGKLYIYVNGVRMLKNVKMSVSTKIAAIYAYDTKNPMGDNNVNFFFDSEGEAGTVYTIDNVSLKKAYIAPENTSQIIYSDDFENEYSGYFDTGKAMPTKVVVGGEHGKICYVEPSSTRQRLLRTATLNSGVISTSVDIYLNSKGTDDTGIIEPANDSRNGDDADNKWKESKPYAIRMRGDGTLYVKHVSEQNKTESETDDIAKIEVGEWHTVEAVMDTETEQLQIYLDGKRVLTDKKLWIFKQKSYGTLINYDNNGKSNIPGVYYDNIKVEVAPSALNSNAFETVVAADSCKYPYGGKFEVLSGTKINENNSYKLNKTRVWAPISNLKDNGIYKVSTDIMFTSFGSPEIGEQMIGRSWSRTRTQGVNYGLSIVNGKLYVTSYIRRNDIQKDKRFELTSLELNKWYNFSYVVDTASERIRFFINGVEKGADYPLYINANSAKDGENSKIYGTVDWGSSTWDGTMYINNYIISEDIFTESLGIFGDKTSSNVTLPTNDVTWIVSKAGAMDETGTVKPVSEPETDVLTARRAVGSEKAARSFNFIVQPDIVSVEVKAENNVVSAKGLTYAVKGTKPAVLILAIYSEQGGLEILRTETDIEDVLSINVSYDELEEGTYTARAFIWSGLDDLTPYASFDDVKFTK